MLRPGFWASLEVALGMFWSWEDSVDVFLHRPMVRRYLVGLRTPDDDPRRRMCGSICSARVWLCANYDGVGEMIEDGAGWIVEVVKVMLMHGITSYGHRRVLARPCVPVRQLLAV